MANFMLKMGKCKAETKPQKKVEENEKNGKTLTLQVLWEMQEGIHAIDAMRL